MTPSQVIMIKRLVEAERSYWQARLNGEPYVQERWRMVEVGKFTGIDKRTARSLEHAGLIEGWSDENGQWWVQFKIDET